MTGTITIDWNGHPLEARTRASLVIANGNIVYEGA